MLEAVLRPQREIAVAERGRRPAGGLLQRPRAAPDRGSRLRAARARLARGGRARAAAAERQPRHVRRLPRRARRSCSSPPRGWAGSDERRRRRSRARPRSSAASRSRRSCRASSQHWKARLQGRRGPSPLQPYRELRRLWGKSAVAPEGTTARLPARAGGRRPRASLAAVLVVPVAAAAPELRDRPRRARPRRAARARPLRGRRRGLGHRQRLLADGREPRPHHRRSSSRRRSCSSLAVRRADRRRRPTCAAIVAATAGTHVWASPALALGAIAFALVVVAETGRQPVDNPDTHLELTMIHEGPLLEYAGRDLAYLQWAAAARHWLVLVLAAQVFLPHPPGVVVAARACCPVVLVVLCAALALARDAGREDAHPARAAAARAPARSRRCSGSRPGSRASRERRASSGSLVALGLARPRRPPPLGRGRARHRCRRCVLVGFALARGGRRPATSSRPARSPCGRVVLAALFLLLVSRTRETRPVRARIAPLARAGIAGRASRWR